MWRFVLLSLLLASCGGQVASSTQAVQSKAMQKTKLSLPDEDLNLLSAHNPQIVHKIKNLMQVTIDDIITMQQLGVTSDILILIISYTNSHFTLSTTDILRLQAEGVSFKVINYMIRT